MLKKMKKGFTLIELMIVVAIIGILAAIAVPNFIKFQARSKQAEAKTNLKACYTAEKAYFQEKDTYSEYISEIGFSPERGNRYVYDTGGNNTFQPRSASTIPADTVPPSWTGIEVDTFKFPGYPANNSGYTGIVTPAVVAGNTGRFTATALGNIDSDAATDSWSISSVTRSSGSSSDADTICAAGNNPAGEPCNDFNDVAR